MEKDRRERVLLSGALQVLWALMLVYLMLLGIAFLFGREVGYEISFGVCLGLVGLVTVTFVAIYLLDRISASFSCSAPRPIGRRKQTKALR